MPVRTGERTHSAQLFEPDRAIFPIFGDREGPVFLPLPAPLLLPFASQGSIYVSVHHASTNTALCELNRLSLAVP